MVKGLQPAPEWCWMGVTVSRCEGLLQYSLQ